MHNAKGTFYIKISSLDTDILIYLCSKKYKLSYFKIYFTLLCSKIIISTFLHSTCTLSIIMLYLDQVVDYLYSYTTNIKHITNTFIIQISKIIRGYTLLAFIYKILIKISYSINSLNKLFRSTLVSLTITPKIKTVSVFSYSY